MMGATDRRDLLKWAGGLGMASLWPSLVARARAIPAARRTGTIEDVQHIVVHMQENRAFDHYLGMLNGVRGFGDPRPLRLAGGRSVFAQPSAEHPDGHVLPYHGDSRTTRSFAVDGADQSHVENMHIFDRGRFGRWGHSGELHNRMLHYGPGDLPFYYALADAFTVCDAYHCSTMTQTYPNRLHLFSGCNGGGTVGGDPQMHNYGEDETPSADMATDKPLRADAYRWTSYAERLQAAGIDWKVYQEYDNFGDNLLSVFPAFRPCDPRSELYRRGRTWVSEHESGPDRTRSDGDQLVAAFRRDVAAGALPQISWIVSAAALSEHPTAEPARGEHLTARLIEALVDHPETFAKTVFILTYDEAGGLFDHMPPPVPPVGRYRGHSTVSTVGEAKDYRGTDLAGGEAHPIGLGIRVPTIIVSPWTSGGHVCSQLFDHTSILRFMERRFGVAEPNISAWRRSVCGDLTSAFDFAAPAGPPPRPLPPTGDVQERIARSLAGTANTIPARQIAATPLPGQRSHRPLPYAVDLIAAATPQGEVRLEFVNRGSVGATFTVHDNHDREEPWHFTIGAGARHATTGFGTVATGYDLTVRGPNGFWRRIAAGVEAAASPIVDVAPHRDGVALTIRNPDAAPAAMQVAMDARYPVTGARKRAIIVPPGAERRIVWPLTASDHWYDLTLTRDGDTGYLYHVAGKVETGRTGRTDPGIGAMQVTA
ncbi:MULTISPECIES: phosphocholine-specific phospholipase C [Sphingomonas]|uniref:phosphocholine-specific phospholipase C n=1 Tax=Sphingomonas TaxID=13687 RepID=UPI000ADE93D1|nr:MULTISPECIES: phospholipase C, phosphocholine-specific [Sphingomonas]